MWPTGDEPMTLACRASSASAERVGVDVHRHADAVEPGVAVLQTEEGAQVDVAGQLDAQVPQGDPGDGGVGGVPDGEAVAERPEQLLDGIRRAVGPAERDRLVRRNGGELPNLGLGPEPTGPTDLGRPRGVGDLGTLLDRFDEAGDGVEVDIVQAGGRVDGHGGTSLGARCSIVDSFSQQFKGELVPVEMPETPTAGQPIRRSPEPATA